MYQTYQNNALPHPTLCLIRHTKANTSPEGTHKAAARVVCADLSSLASASPLSYSYVPLLVPLLLEVEFCDIDHRRQPAQADVGTLALYCVHMGQEPLCSRLPLHSVRYSEPAVFTPGWKVHIVSLHRDPDMGPGYPEEDQGRCSIVVA
jgi:hypothetical protein